MKTRIVKRTHVDNKVTYVIQQKCWYSFGWIDAGLDNALGNYSIDYFSTIEEAEKNLCYFDDSKHTDVVVKEGNIK